MHLLEELGAPPGRIFHDCVPTAGHGPNGRPLGFGEWFLSRPAPHWHDPSGRAPRA